MEDSTGDKSNAANEQGLVDLSELQSLQFGPDWSERNTSSIDTNTDADHERGGRDRAKKQGRRDRRPQQRPQRREGAAPAPSMGGHQQRPMQQGEERRRPHGDNRRGDDSHGQRRGPRKGAHTRPPEFRPVVDVLFYPEDTPFKALCHAMRTSCRTYELFEIARLILQKPERFVVVMKTKEELEGPKEFFISVPDGLPFASEKDVIQHIVNHHIEQFFEIEEKEVDLPKGNFQVIHKCGLTGELIGPPNYHRYQALVQEHYAANIHHLPFEKFTAKIQSVKDEESIQEWMQKMSKVTHYKPKGESEDAEGTFDTLESAKYYLQTRRRDEVLKTSDQARLTGKDIDSLPRGPIRRSIEATLEHQRTFPLDTSNNLRGRLRRLKFTIYKKGPKGVSFVCAVKRKFREPNKTFSDSIQGLIDFIEAHPQVPVSELPEQFLGITLEEKVPQESEKEKAPEIEKVSKEEAEKIVEAHELKRRQAAEARKQEAAKGEQAPAAVEGEPATEAAETPPAEAATEAVEAPVTEAEEAPVEAVAEEPVEVSASEAPTAEDSADEEKVSETREATTPQATIHEPDKPQVLSPDELRVRALLNSLRWLVTEGFVTEYGDGTLYAHPVAEVRKPEREEKPEGAAGNEAVAEAAVKTDSPEAEASDESPAVEAPKPEPQATEEVAFAPEPHATDKETPKTEADTEPKATEASSPKVKESAPAADDDDAKKSSEMKVAGVSGE